MVKYATIEYFIENFGPIMPEENMERAIRDASKQINSYLIIKPQSIDDLSDYEKEIFAMACCQLSIFNEKNKKYKDNVLSSLSIAGTSYSFGDTDATFKTKTKSILQDLDDTRWMNRFI